MNVYKIRDHETPYAGGMALVAANDEIEAISVFKENTEYSYSHDCNDLTCYTAILLNNAHCDTDTPYLITEDWYYE